MKGDEERRVEVDAAGDNGARDFICDGVLICGGYIFSVGGFEGVGEVTFLLLITLDKEGELTVRDCPSCDLTDDTDVTLCCFVVDGGGDEGVSTLLIDLLPVIEVRVVTGVAVCSPS